MLSRLAVTIRCSARGSDGTGVSREERRRSLMERGPGGTDTTSGVAGIYTTLPIASNGL